MRIHMNNGYYLSTYLHINEVAHLTGMRIRHDQNVSLWHKNGDKIDLVHYWELERITGLKKNNRSLFTVEQARELLDSLLAEYRLTLNDMQAIWGTPQLQSAHDYHSIEEVRDISYHSLCHLYSALLMDTDLFYQEDILGLSLDGGPDSVIDLQVSKKNYYAGCVSRKGNVNLMPLFSPGFIWTYARKRFGYQEGTLMALANACNCEAYIFDEEPVWIKDIHGLSNSFEYVKMLSDKINQLTPKDAGILFSGFDDRFSLEDNRISMAMKQIQKISLKIVEHNIDRLIEEYHCDPHQMYLAVAGGYMLNCPTNTHLMKKYGFRGFIAPPCISDTGMSMGIALYAFYKQMNRMSFHINHAYYGNSDRDSLSQLLKENKYAQFIQEISEFHPEQAAEDIMQAPIVWFNGRAEIGPRALGNRSLIADPRFTGFKDELNRIKQRQWWRPVAPIVLEENLNDWFESFCPSPFMLHAFQVRPDKAEQIPAVSHLDNTARVQTMNEYENKMLYDVIKAFMQKTGVPIICNTSLNDRGEPIIDSCEQALNFALRKKIRIVYLNGKRFTLKNHEKYELTQPLERKVNILAFRNEGERQSLLKQYNPYQIPNETLVYYFLLRPELQDKYALTNENDVRMLNLFVKMIFNKLNSEEIPGITLEGK